MITETSNLDYVRERLGRDFYLSVPLNADPSIAHLVIRDASTFPGPGELAAKTQETIVSVRRNKVPCGLEGVVGTLSDGTHYDATNIELSQILRLTGDVVRLREMTEYWFVPESIEQGEIRGKVYTHKEGYGRLGPHIGELVLTVEN